MDTNPAPTTTEAAPGTRWVGGCAIAAIILLALVAYGAYALENLEKGIDGYGQMEQAGPSGHVSDPLGPGATAQFEDGLKITVSPPLAAADGAYAFSVTYENGTDSAVRPGGRSREDSVSDIGQAALVVRPGKSHDDYVADYDLDWLNEEASAAALMPPLAEGETRTVPVRIKPTRAGIPVTVEVAVPDAGYRETAYFQLTAG
ncbi:hypothetical protein QR97_26020 [Streptomyces sp. PBH53]|uniref:hypothetical protein n=1 Tax=Streptomyces TaxID=1883 RepID=UPI0006553340|nr:hypothetical protein [Streptomyces sp. PBH53]AKN72762.1 hypothetical protein QR97_26020 [Streptomyces sp. PBH53]